MRSKRQLRSEIESLKSSLSLEKRREYDKNIYETVMKSQFYKNSSIIFIFVSYNNEVDTHSIIKKAIEDGKIICVPKIISKKDGMKAVRIGDFNDLYPGAYGILEPLDFSNTIEPSNIDTIFLPGVAFDLSGGRVGYGGGFYDRFLKNAADNTNKIALSYSFQLMDSVPMEKEDERIDGIITEKGIHTI